MTKKRRKRTPNDGLEEVFEDGDYLDGGSFMFLDGNSDEFEKGAPMLHDGMGRQAGFRPGFCLSTDTALRDAADAAYEERRQRLGGPVRKPTSLADAQADAERAYQERNERLRNAWKERPEASG
jgi:hypothetical protein